MLNLFLGKYIVFILTLFRVAGIIGFAPLFGSALIPRKLKIAFSVLLAIVLFPLVPVEQAALPQTVPHFVLIAGKELAIGVIMGFVANMVFIGIQFAGTLIGRQIGFAIANILNPLTESAQSIIGQFYFLLSLAIFVLIDGPGMLIRSIAVSFQEIPIGHINIDVALFEVIVRSTQTIFVTAIKIAAPMVVALFMVLIGMGFVARTVPQLNILVVGFSLNIGVGLFVMLVSMVAISLVIKNMLWEVVAFEVPDLVKVLGG